MQVDPNGPRTDASVPVSRSALGSAPAGTAGHMTGITRLGIDAAACAINEPAPATNPDVPSGPRSGRAKYPLIRQFTAKIRSDREVPE